MLDFVIRLMFLGLLIKDLTCLVGNSFKASMNNDMLDFIEIKSFFVLILVLVKSFFLLN